MCAMTAAASCTAMRRSSCLGAPRRAAARALRDNAMPTPARCVTEVAANHATSQLTQTTGHISSGFDVVAVVRQQSPAACGSDPAGGAGSVQVQGLHAAGDVGGA